MIKLSRTGITTLKRQYKSVLLKCLLINAGILFAAGSAMAADTWSGAITATNDFMDDLATNHGWDKVNGNVTGYGVSSILTAMSGAATNTDAAVTLVNDTTKGNEALNTRVTTLEGAGYTTLAAVKADIQDTTTDTAIGKYLSTTYDAYGAASGVQTDIETKLADGTSYDIDAKTLKVGGEDVATEAYVDDLAKMKVAGTSATYAVGDAVNDAVAAIDGALKTAQDDIDAAEAVNTTQSATLNTLAGIIDGGTVSTDGVYTAGEVLTAYDSKSTLTGVVNALETNKQENLVIAADSGLKLESDGKTLSVLAGAGMEVTSAGVGIKNLGVTTDMLGSKVVTTEKIGDSAVDTLQIKNLAVTTDKLAEGAVTSAKIADGTIVADDLADGAVTTAKLDAGAVTYAKLNADLIGSKTDIENGETQKLTTAAAVKAYAAGIDADNVFTGFNTFKNDNGIKITDAAESGNAQLKIDTTSITGKTVLNIIAPADGIYTTSGIRTSDSFSVISADGTKEYITADATMFEIGDGTDTQFKVTNASGNIETAGTLTLGSTAGAGATLTGTDTDLTSSVKVVSANGFEVDDDNSFLTGAFKLDGTTVNSIDTDGSAVAAGTETALATGATVKLGAENADFTGTTDNVVQTTLKGAIEDLDAAIGDRTYTNGYNIASDDDVTTSLDDLDTVIGDFASIANANNNLGGADVSENLDNLDTNMGDLATLTHEAFNGDTGNITTALNTLATNVETATGGTFTAGAWAATVDNTVGANGYTYTESADLMDAINQVAGNVGTADELTEAYNGVDAANSVNANINAVNATIGDITTLNELDDDASIGNAMTNGTGTAPTTVVEALNNIDATLGTIHGLANKLGPDYQGNLAEGTTVEQHLTALDSAIGNRARFAEGRYTAGSESVVDAVMSLDENLDGLANEVRDFKKEYKSGMAQMAAMSALVPNARAHGNTQISVGTGAYEGHTAAAVGGFHWINDNLLLNAGVSYGNSNNVAYRAGLTWSW